jgi:REP element-mobilizing transposase RayT
MRTRYKVGEKDSVYFVTSTIVEWLPVFTSEKYFIILIDTIKYYQLNKRLKVHAYVILDNHFHLLTSGEDLSKTLSLIKSFTAKKIIEELQKDRKDWLLHLFEFYKLSHKKESTHQVWQEGFHPQQIISENMLQQKFDYIHMNPVKRGLVVEPYHWRFSSASYYYKDKEGDIKIDEIE